MLTWRKKHGLPVCIPLETHRENQIIQELQSHGPVLLFKGIPGDFCFTKYGRDTMKSD